MPSGRRTCSRDSARGKKTWTAERGRRIGKRYLQIVCNELPDIREVVHMAWMTFLGSNMDD